MKVITCASYHGTGSSAIGDLLSEFQNINAKSSFEPAFLHYSFGVSDLEYALIDNPNRHNSSFYLNNFIRYTKYISRGYNRYFKNAWGPLVDNYIKSLIIASFPGYRSRLIFMKSKWKGYANILLKKICKVSFETKDVFYCTVTDEDLFLESTRRLVRELLVGIHDDREFLFIDQLFPSSNLKRFYRYVDFSIKTIIVERDPRDVYLMGKYVYKSRVIPTQSPETFCAWYKNIRITQKDELKLKNVSLVKFEDLIYKYEETIQQICFIIGTDKRQHVAKGEVFKPWDSIQNTRLWEIFPNDTEGILYIEKELKEYLYLYENEDIELYNYHVAMPGRVRNF